MLNKVKSVFSGAAGDSFLLMFVRIVTLSLGIITTRILSGYFSLHDYGTYSAILLLTNSISSITILGMMDGLNYFFCREKDPLQRNARVSTIFSLQLVIGVVVSILVLLCAVPISAYFSNADVKRLLVFAALLPITQNSISLLQILFISVGKARHIAVRNFIVSVLKLAAILVACYVIHDIACVLICQVITDVLQIIYFYIVLKRNGYLIELFHFDKTSVKEVLTYCIPMAMSTIIRSLYRDCDKYIISYYTDSVNLAVYTNASKQLPFDLIMSSFCTVLLPYLTKYIAQKKHHETVALYRSFLELSFVSTSILAAGALCSAPELMRFLYSEKYLQSSYGISVFMLYIVVDIFVVFTITLLLSASGKTFQIMTVSVSALLLNVFLDIVLFKQFSEIGPALATLITTLLQGLLLLQLSAKCLGTRVIYFFDKGYYALFIFESIGFMIFARLARQVFIHLELHYFFVLGLTVCLYCLPMVALNYKRIKKAVKHINSQKLI